MNEFKICERELVRYFVVIDRFGRCQNVDADNH